MLQTLYINTTLNKQIIDKKACLEAISYRVIENRSYLDEIISKLKQKKHHFEVIYNIANHIKHNLTSAILYNTHISLENMGIIKKTQKGKYKIVDIFLEILLRQKDDKMLAFDDKLELEL